MYDSYYLTEFLIKRTTKDTKIRSISKNQKNTKQKKLLRENFVIDDFAKKFADFCSNNKLMDSVDFDKIISQLDSVMNYVIAESMKLKNLTRIVNGENNFVFLSKNKVKFEFCQKVYLQST